MTASNASTPTSPLRSSSSEGQATSPQPKPKSPLPRAGELLRVSVALTKRYANDVYGFAAYLLFPTILAFGVQGITGTLGNILVSVVNVLFVLIACWIQATIIVLVRMRLGHPKKDPDPRSIGLYATTVLGTLTFTVLISGLLQLAGYICLILPGIVLTVLFTFAPEEVVLRGCGPLSALAASRAKVQPQFFPVLWRLLVLTGATLGVYFLLATLIIAIVSFATGIDPTALTNVTPAWLDALLTVLQIVFLPPILIGHTMLYLSLDEPVAEVSSK